MKLPAVSRRAYLATVSAVASVIAGCSGVEDDAADGASADDAPSGDAPEIVVAEAVPVAHGTEMNVHLEAESERAIESAAVEYGDRVLTERTDGNDVSLEGTLEDTHLTGEGVVTFRVEDVEGKEAVVELDPDDTAPTVGFESRPTDAAGELLVTIEAADDVGLSRIELVTDDRTLLELDPSVVGGTAAHETDDELIDITAVDEDLRLGRPRALRVAAVDWNGNRAEQAAESYVRIHDVMMEPRLDIGVVYIPPAGGGLHRCLEGTEAVPSVGMYDRPIPPAVTSRHVDQMTGHGIRRVLYGWEGRDISYEKAEAFLASELLTQLDEIEVFFGSGALTELFDEHWREESLPEQLPFLRDRFLAHEKAATIDGRPVVSTWNVRTFALGDEREKVLEEFDGFEGFVDEFRSHLRLDGTDPFLVAGVGTDTIDEQRRPLVEAFDAIGTWFPPTIHESGETGEPASWAETLAITEDAFEELRTFALEEGMEFVPFAFPGYDETGNECYGRGRKLPRSQERFRDVLELAETYATTDRINIASWNDWPEGHQIEPGVFRDEAYATDYLEVVREFQGG